jgi:hypothetical protein
MESSVLRPYAFEKLTVGATVARLTVGVMVSPGHSPRLAIITCEGDIRYRVDGAVPDSVTGHLAAADTAIFVWHGAIGRLAMIRTSTDAPVAVTYYE